MRTVGIGAKKNTVDDTDILKKAIKAKDKQIKELKAQLESMKESGKDPEKSK